MNSFLYAINIGTLATWLSVAGFGTLGIVVSSSSPFLKNKDSSQSQYAHLETTVLTEDFPPGDTTQPSENDTKRTDEEFNIPLPAHEPLPSPPEMPDVAETSPLPEIPEMLPPAPNPAKIASPAPLTSKQNRPLTPADSSQGMTEPKGKSASATSGQNSVSGMPNATRLAGGRMPSPSYPTEARAKGQSGTVVVEFVVGENGDVVSAYAKSPSPWPILNECAVSAVRRWKFQPGSVAKYARPIVFKLD